METDAEHIDPKPGETGNDIAKNGKVYQTSLANQTSSRADRDFDAHTFTLGLEWSGGGK